MNDEQLLEAFQRWQTAFAAADTEAARRALAELAKLKELAGASGLDPFTVALVRASRQRSDANDQLGAVELAVAAVALSPRLPQARLGLAEAYWRSDPLDSSRYLKEFAQMLRAVASDRRALRPLLADVGATFLAAWVATAAAVVLVLLIRRGRYLLHDFRHLLPRAASAWHALVLGLTLLSLPLILRFGLAPMLLCVAIALSFYLTLAERLVAGVLIAALGAVPSLAGGLVENSAFVGTRAEAVYELEQGGLGAGSHAAHLEARAEAADTDFAELFAAARYHLRRGSPARANVLFKLALAKKHDDPSALTNLGNAMFAEGDLEGALAMYRAATQSDPQFAPAFFNQAKLHERRSVVLPRDRAAVEVDLAHGAMGRAKALDPSLATRVDPPPDGLHLSGLLIYPPLPSSALHGLARASDAARGAKGQLTSFLLGNAPPQLAAWYPAALGALAVLLGAGGARVGASRACQKCGRAVCHRCDPELVPGGKLCQQCVSLFTRKTAVPAHFRVRKQIEISRFQDRQERWSYVLGLLFSGGGHLFAGLTVRGAVYAYGFSFVVVAFLMRHGLVRPPYGELPLWLRMAPLALLFVGVYLASLRGLYKRQSR